MFFDLPDFLTYRATGDLARSNCSLACKCSYVPPEIPDSKGWNAELFETIGLTDIVRGLYFSVYFSRGCLTHILSLHFTGQGRFQVARRRRVRARSDSWSACRQRPICPSSKGAWPQRRYSSWKRCYRCLCWLDRHRCCSYARSGRSRGKFERVSTSSCCYCRNKHVSHRAKPRGSLCTRCMGTLSACCFPEL
jgi:hypothetical protein